MIKLCFEYEGKPQSIQIKEELLNHFGQFKGKDKVELKIRKSNEVLFKLVSATIKKIPKKSFMYYSNGLDLIKVEDWDIKAITERDEGGHALVYEQADSRLNESGDDFE